MDGKDALNRGSSVNCKVFSALIPVLFARTSVIQGRRK
jgi:hypothetical protein